MVNFHHTDLDITIVTSKIRKLTETINNRKYAAQNILGIKE